MKASLLICAGAAFALAAAVDAGEPQAFASARTAAAALPQLHSLLVSHRGRLAFEYYAPKLQAAALGEPERLKLIFERASE
jgi:hypothetical protein